MDILPLLREKEKELGLHELSVRLKYPKGLLSQHLKGTRNYGPKLEAAFKAVYDPVEIPRPEEALPATNGSHPIAEASVTDDGLNLSYAPEEKPRINWEAKDVCLCIPSHDDIKSGFFFCMMAIAMRYKFSIRMEHRDKDSMIARSRNHLAKRFLKTEASWSIWFDDDMVFPIGHAGIYATMTGMRHVGDQFMGLHTIDRLLSWNKTIVGGCYWDRFGKGKLIAGGNAPILSPIPSDNLAAVAFVGTGCLAVHRQVFLDIAKKFPETMADEALGNEAGFFTPIQTPHMMMGEDQAFAWRATEAGHPSWLDLGLCLGHIGDTIHGMPQHGSRI